MGAGDGPIDVGYVLWATGYGPAYKEDQLEFMTLTDGVNLRVTFHVGAIQTTLDPSNPTAGTGWAVTWGPYNGLIGQDPEAAAMFSVRLEPIDPNGPPPSGTLTFVGLSIVVSGLTNINVIHDTFHGPDGQQLVYHTPDEAPDPVPSGNIVGWHGRAVYADTIVGNKLVSGGNPGIVKFGRIWTNRNDLFKVYADITRKRNDVGDVAAVLGRCSAVPGNSDGDGSATLDLIGLYFQNYSNTQVVVSWVQEYIDGSGAHIVQQDYQFAVIPWATGISRELIMIVVGPTLYLYVADAVTGDNGILLRTVTLGTPWNDASHQYAGYGDTQIGDAIEMTAFGSLPLSVVTVNPGGGSPATIESVGIAAWDEQPNTENAASLVGGGDGEINAESVAVLATEGEGGFNGESLGGVEATEGFEAEADPRWFPVPGGVGGWKSPVAPDGGWVPRAKPGGSWGPS
jgi:hypothetical protein